MTQAVQSDTRSTFIAQLLAPLASAAEHRSFLAEVRHEAEMAWKIAYHRLYAAQYLRDHAVHVRRVAELASRTLKVPVEDAAERKAQLALIAEVDRMMMTPAPTTAALRLKRKLRGVSGGRDRWEAAIAADEARLEQKSTSRAA